MLKWYERIIGKTGLEILLHKKKLASYVYNQGYGEGKTKIIRINMTDLKTNKDCVIEIKICE
jgi:hypothetical protein